MPLLSLLAFCLLAWLTCAAAAAGGEAGSSPRPQAPRIWSGVVLATVRAHPGEPPEALRRYATKLKNIFGYNQYELIGESSTRMDGPNERWLVPTKDFSLSVQNHKETGPHRGPSTISLFQGNHRLAEFDANLSSQRPLFIRGPFYAGGQLVIVVHTAEPSEIPGVRGESRPPYVSANALLPFDATPSRERERPNLQPGYLLTIPGEGFHPIPGDRFGPIAPGRYGPAPERYGPYGPYGPFPAERYFLPYSPYGFGPVDRFGPGSGARRGDQAKTGKPLKAPPY
jgi:hypothetical protein